MDENWMEKHAPKKISDILGSGGRELLAWYESWKPGKAALLYGPPGSGKTIAVHVLAKEKGLDLVEINASDERNAEAMETLVGSAAKQQSLFKKGKIVLVDEVDGLSGREDRGGAGALLKVVKEAKYPIILTANDAYEEKLKNLRTACTLIQFTKVRSDSMAKKLREIAKSESVETEDEILSSIARSSGGDLRAAIMDLQTLGTAKKKITREDLAALGYREQEQSVFDALRIIFKTRTLATAVEAVEKVDKDPEEMFWWIEQNVTAEYEDPKEVAAAFEALSKADLMRARIRVRQNWRFRKYMVDLMCGGVALAKKEAYRKFVPYRPPARLLIYGATKGMRADLKTVIAKLDLHASEKKIKSSYLPYLKLLVKNREFCESLKDKLTEDDIEVLKSLR